MSIYRLDNLDMKGNFGVRVLGCEGNLSFLKRKGPTGQSWPDEDGEESFTAYEDIKFEARNITLLCLLRGETKRQYLWRLNNLKRYLEFQGLHTLYIGATGITHNVYFCDGGTVSPATKWSDGITVGRFNLIFKEPVPARALSATDPLIYPV